jgi:2,4-dienoyl-CoA reductase-like NADH-dependent reductase (Old Yellow Enzyme family)
MVSAIAPKLFTSFKLGGRKNPVELSHRVAMAPLTRVVDNSTLSRPFFMSHYECIQYSFYT